MLPPAVCLLWQSLQAAEGSTEIQTQSLTACSILQTTSQIKIIQNLANTQMKNINRAGMGLLRFWGQTVWGATAHELLYQPATRINFQSKA